MFLDRVDEIMKASLRDPNVAEERELVLCHPDRSHGIFLRDGGAVDINSGVQVVGVTPDGLGISVQAMDVQSSVTAIQCRTLWINTAPNGLIIDGYVPDYGILHGDLIGRYLMDAQVVIKSGSLEKVQDGGREPAQQPACSQCPGLVSVPLSSLIQPHAWSRPVDPKALSKLMDVVNRVRGGSGA
jgi:hypothetical protein